MPNQNEYKIDERVLVLAPVGRDAVLTCQKLGELGFTVESCVDLQELSDEFIKGAGAAFLTEEGLTPDSIDSLITVLRNQPQWSDFPVIVLTTNSTDSTVKLNRLKRLAEAGNVTLVERPARIITLASIIQSALRARRRQYEVRDHLIRRKQMEESLKHRAEELSEANRLKDEFLATVSHELRTPLSAIMGWTNLLRDKRLSDENRQRALETIERNGQAQAQLISDLLDVSRVVSGKLRLDIRSVNLESIINAALDTIRPAAEAKSIELDVAFDKSCEQIKGDPNRLQQVIWNLLSNAVKFTPNEGHVKVETVCSESQVEIIVADTGQGITEGFLPYVFDRFRQADSTSTRQHGGLGLGLSIVKHLVEMHGGTVSVKSPGKNKGSIFRILLPAHSRQEATEPRPLIGPAEYNPIDGASIPRLDGIQILFVDDIADVRELFSTLLTAYGADVRAASSAAEALELMTETRPDILISDIGMPVEDGYTLIQKIRAMEIGKGKRIPAVALTAYAGAQDRMRILSAGYQMHVTKPVDGAELATVVNCLVKTDRASKQNGKH